MSNRGRAYGYDAYDEDEYGWFQGYGMAGRMNAERNIYGLQEAVDSRQDYTPDMLLLKASNCDYFPVFVTGEEQSGGRFDELLDGCTYFGKAYTAQIDFLLFSNKSNKGPKGVAFQYTSDIKDDLGYWPQAASGLKGEVYGVPLHVLCKLDRYNENTIMTTRVPVMIRVPDQSIKSMVAMKPRSEYLKCFTYFGKSKVWQHRSKYGPDSISLAYKVESDAKGAKVFSLFD